MLDRERASIDIPWDECASNVTTKGSSAAHRELVIHVTLALDCSFKLRLGDEGPLPTTSSCCGSVV